MLKAKEVTTMDPLACHRHYNPCDEGAAKNVINPNVDSLISLGDAISRVYFGTKPVNKKIIINNGLQSIQHKFNIKNNPKNLFSQTRQYTTHKYINKYILLPQNKI